MRVPIRSIPTFTAMVAALALAACGSDDQSDPLPNQPRQVAEAWLAALQSGDRAGTCSLVTHRGLSALHTLALRRDVAPASASPSEACAEYLERFFPPQENPCQSISEVTVKGRTAIAQLDSTQCAIHIPGKRLLREEGGQWLVDWPPAETKK
jgi:hypothetical protein